MSELLDAAPKWMVEHYEKCVEHGMNDYLDVKHVGWEAQIDLSKLDLSMGCRCVLGQVGHKVLIEQGFVPVFQDGVIEWYEKPGDNDEAWNGYSLLLERDFSKDGEVWASSSEASKYGFYLAEKVFSREQRVEWGLFQNEWNDDHIDDQVHEWSILDEVWIAAIKRRFDTGILSDTVLVQE